jgi:hypothetical protein
LRLLTLARGTGADYPFRPRVAERTRRPPPDTVGTNGSLSLGPVVSGMSEKDLLGLVLGAITVLMFITGIVLVI